MVFIYLGVGANLGDRLKTIETALRMVKLRIGTIVDSSCLYETVAAYTKRDDQDDQDDQDSDSTEANTPPPPVKDPDYLNLCVKIRLTPGCQNIDCHLQYVLDELFEIERCLGRPSERIKFASRTIDLDILLAEFDQKFVSMNYVASPQRDVCSVCRLPLSRHDLMIPHVRMLERRFVLEPLSDILTSFNGIDVKALSKSLAESSQFNDGRDLTPTLIHPWGRSDSQMWRKSLLPVGILNLTPDSFSDGGMYYSEDSAASQAESLDRALAQVAKFKDQGAAAIDIGAESTWIKSKEITPHTELHRLIPFFRRLVQRPELHLPILLDTRRSDVLKAISQMTPVLLNDVSGLTYDEKMIDTVEALGCTVVIMHSRGSPQSMTNLKHYRNTAEIGTELNQRIRAALERGIYRWRVIADPGIGFAKGMEQNLAVIDHLDEWYSEIPHGLPVCYGWSRKQFLDKLEWDKVCPHWDIDDSIASWPERRDRRGIELIKRVQRDVCLCLVRLHTLKYWKDFA